MVVRFTPFAVAGTLFVGVASFVWATEPMKPSILLAADSDKMLGLKASAALAADPELAGLNLTIDVLNRVAVVGGEVPDESVVPKIRAILRKVPGLLEVKVSGWVPAQSDPLAQMVGEKLRGESKPSVSLKPTPSNLPSLVVQPRLDQMPQRPLLPPLLALPRPNFADVAPEPQRPRDDHRTPGTVIVQRFSPSTHSQWLLEPIAPGTTSPSMKPTLETSAEELRANDERFTGLTIEFRNRVVVIGGQARSHEDVWEFATQLRKVPGIEKVIIGNVAAK